MVYINKIISLSDRLDGNNSARKELKSLIKLTDQGQVQLYLGIYFYRITNCTLLSQNHYYQTDSKKFVEDSAETATTAMMDNIRA